MAILDFFSHHSKSKESASAPTLPHQRLRDKQLQLGITAFNAGLAAKKNKEIDAQAYQGDDPQLLFQKAAQCFKQSMIGEANHSILALAHGYLTLIRFDGLDGQEKQQDITADMLHTCEALNALGQTDKGLKDMPQDFQNAFLTMINRLYRLYYQYKDREKWYARLSTQIEEYQQQQEAIVGRIDSYGKANEYRAQKIKDIDTVKATFTLLQQHAPVTETTDSVTSIPSPLRKSL
ncbi:MAG: hypothetical protein K2Q33_08210 [Gammaproteobacteria bacterium]|nr:hypothetical protein [Gammaproteobacteria bacterium]